MCVVCVSACVCGVCDSVCACVHVLAWTYVSTVYTYMFAHMCVSLYVRMYTQLISLHVLYAR